MFCLNTVHCASLYCNLIIQAVIFILIHLLNLKVLKCKKCLLFSITSQLERESNIDLVAIVYVQKHLAKT